MKGGGGGSGWRTADLYIVCLNSQVYIFVYHSKFCGLSHLVVKCPKLQDFHLILKCLFHWQCKWCLKKEGFD